MCLGLLSDGSSPYPHDEWREVGLLGDYWGLEVPMKDLAMIRGLLDRGLFSSRETWAHLLLGD